MKKTEVGVVHHRGPPERSRRPVDFRTAQESKRAINFQRMTRSLPVREAMEMLRPHDHVCLVYEDRHEWEESVMPFLAAGLRRNQKCIYIVDAHTGKQVEGLLGKEGVEVKNAESSGQFEILKEKDAYTQHGYFDPDMMIEFMVSETGKAIAEGYAAMRLSGEMSWALRGRTGSEKLLEYESKLNRFFRNHSSLAICQYDLNRFSPEVIRGVILTHPLVLVNGYLYQNYNYMEPEEFLAQSRRRA